MERQKGHMTTRQGRELLKVRVGLSVRVTDRKYET